MKIKRLWLITLIPLGWLLTYLAQLDPMKTEEYFSKGLYRYYSYITSVIYCWIPISIAEILLVGGVVFLLITMVRSLWNSCIQRKLLPIIQYLINMLVITSIIYFWFLISCGLNYYRMDFAWYYGEQMREYTVMELKNMCISYIVQAGEIRELLKEEDFQLTNYEMSKKSVIAFHQLAKTYPILYPLNGIPKSIQLSALMSHTKITGFYFPFTMEANVNVDIPTYQIPFVMLHEQAHQRGFMQEDEANFIAFLAGKDSEDLLIRYSAYMSAANYGLNSLYKVDQVAYREAYVYFTSLQLIERKESYDYWTRFNDQVVSQVATTMNDNYLKANGQMDGVASYGRVTDLLLLDYYKKNTKNE